MSNELCCLIVEDHEFQRLMLAKILSSLCQVHILEAANGVEAEKILREMGGRIDLVITDLMMPRMDGIELIPVMRKFSPSTSVVLASVDEVNLLTGEAIAKGAGLRVAAVIRKPLTAAKLAPVLAAFGRAG